MLITLAKPKNKKRQTGPAVHSTAIVHPSVVIEGDVTIGPRCHIGPHCYLVGPLVIGADNVIRAGAIIGTPAEHNVRVSQGTVYVGNRNRIGEHSVIQRGTGDRDTEIGNDCFAMDHLHLGHDSVLEDGVITAPNVVLAGHTRIHRGAALGSCVVTHQFSTIGAHSMIGMGGVVTRDVQPFSLVKGNPARFQRVNAKAFSALPFGEDALQVDDGRFVSEHPVVDELLRHFAEEVRRTILKVKPS